MLRVVAVRLGLSIPLILAVTFVTFVMNSLAPGDLARTILQGEGTEQQYQELRTQLGLDQPILLRYGKWLTAAVHGDLGQSHLTGESVVAMLNGRFAVTASLMAGTFLVCVTLGLLLGIASAIYGGWIGKLIDVFSLTGLVLPSFWLALVFISIFAVTLHWLPATGYVPFASNPGGWLLSLILPVLSMSLLPITSVAKFTRDAMNDVMSREFIRALRASGLPERRIVWKHALRNASLPVVTVVGLVMVSAITGTVFVEKVFVLPGMGGLAVQAALENDIVVLQGAALYFALITIAINLVVDLSYGWLNPRVRVG